MRSSFLLLGLLLIAPSLVAQSSQSDSQTLQALLNEVHQLREDLQTTTVAGQRAQILLFRVQAQESVVRHIQERVDDTRSKLTQIQAEQKRLTANLKQITDSLDPDENPASRKESEQIIARFKAALETQSVNEQEAQTRLTEAQEQLRIEQAKLAELEDHLDRLEKTLETHQDKR